MKEKIEMIECLYRKGELRPTEARGQQTFILIHFNPRTVSILTNLIEIPPTEYRRISSTLQLRHQRAPQHRARQEPRPRAPPQPPSRRRILQGRHLASLSSLPSSSKLNFNKNCQNSRSKLTTTQVD